MKNDRHQAILRLINSRPISTQDELLEGLQNEGFSVTQATVSRDIKNLRIVKAHDKDGIYRYITINSRSDESNRFVDIFSSSVIKITSAMNDVVIKCYAGMAQGACAALDELFGDMVIGTLAGDDTILAIAANEKSALELTDKLNQLIK